MRTAKLYRYDLPMNSGVVLRNHTLHKRSGLLIFLQENNKSGWGEIAPLPTFSGETLLDAEAQVRLWLKEWQANQVTNLTAYFPSVAFGVSFALAELEGKLGEQADFRSALLCSGELESLRLRLLHTDNHIGKVKISRENPSLEGEKVNTLLNALPDLKLRLDANRGWTLTQAAAFAEKITNENKARIQFIEEPCHLPAFSRQFAQTTGIAIAWDESLREPHFKLENEPNLAAIVIKPTLTGSFEQCISLLQQAHQQGIMAIISSSLESSLALTQLARFAHQFTPNTLAGLDTLPLMQHQLLRKWHTSTLPLIGVDHPFVREIVL